MSYLKWLDKTGIYKVELVGEKMLVYKILIIYLVINI